jgi:hypothetical protein
MVTTSDTDHRLHQRSVGTGRSQIHDQAAVNLDVADRQVPEHAERRDPAPEVVDPDIDARPAQRLTEPMHITGADHHRVLVELDGHPSPGHSVPCRLLDDHACDLPVD